MDDCRARLFRLIDATPNLDWLLLTKRPENIVRMWKNSRPTVEASLTYRDNVWLGYSASTQADLEKGLPELLKCRNLCDKLFLSLEPLVEEIDLQDYLYDPCPACAEGCPDPETGVIECRACDSIGLSNDSSFLIDWVITGGESGPNARPCNVEWIRSIVSQCKEAGVPCFVKQLGSNVESLNHAEQIKEMRQNSRCTAWRAYLDDPKGGDMDEWPRDIRVREVPDGKS